MREQLRPVQMDANEIASLLALDVPAHLAMLLPDGAPVVIPIWFLWTGDEFVMTSASHRAHVRRLEANPAASVSVDVEEPEEPDGQRPNRQVRGTGTVTLAADEDGAWTRRITEKYLRGAGAERQATLRSADSRVVIRLAPSRLVALKSIGHPQTARETPLPEPRDEKRSPTIEDAIVLALRCHGGQLYLSPHPEPYILHPLRVMLNFSDDTDRVVAVLHDAIEDSPLSITSLRNAGYSEKVVTALDAVTKRDDESYENYIARVAQNPLATRIKLADLADNLANNLLDPDSPGNELRIRRYRAAIAELEVDEAARSDRM